MTCAGVAQGSEVQARGSIQVSSLCCHCCPLRARPTSPLPVPPITLPCASPWMHTGCLGVLLNPHFTLTSVRGFSRGSQVLVFVVFWFYSKEKARKSPSSLQNILIKGRGFISLS